MHFEASPYQAGAGKEGRLPSDKWGNGLGQVWEGGHKLMFLKEDDMRLTSTPLSGVWDAFTIRRPMIS